jgi:hypothetical protein
MYRNDQDALLARADEATKEADKLRRENEQMRAAMAAPPTPYGMPPPYGLMPMGQSSMSLPPQVIYGEQFDARVLPVGERARLASHRLQRFPVWAVAILHIVTLGLFPFIHFGLMHDRMPSATYDDPSAGKAIGFQFIPIYWMYWIFFSTLRLNDRLTLQLRLRGMGNRSPRGYLIATCIVSVIPYVGWVIGVPIMWLIAVCLLQSKVNRVAALPPTQWDAAA